MSDRNNAGAVYRNTSFRNGGRKAGLGMYEDDYSEESGYCGYSTSIGPIRFSSDGIKPEDLNGPCVVVQEGRKKSLVEEEEVL